MKPEYTHYGWFYFVPINCYFTDDGGFGAEMRLTGWQWPIVWATSIHNLFCWLHNDGFDFPVHVSGEIKK